MKSPLISVIIPTHNNGNELRRALLSVIEQGALSSDIYSIEIIVVNDGSDESYLGSIQQLALDYSVCRILHSEKQVGPAEARNMGIRSARGDFIGFLDADDEWPRNKVSLLMPYFQASEIEVVGGKIKYIVQEGLPTINMNFEDQEQRITHVHLGALFVRREVFERDLLFDSSLTFSEDVDWWFRLREKGIGIVLLEATTLLYHVHGHNMSINKSMKDLQLLKIFHNSIKRRNNTPSNPYMPQIKDFRIDQRDPLISIVLPLYNGKDLISKSINSVINQTYKNWELIVIDDGSVDQGADFIAGHYPQVTIIRQENRGVAAARNTGIRHCNAEIIAFLDQDDEWMPSKLQAQWDLLKKDPYCSFITCNHRFVCMEGIVLPANFSKKLFEEHRSLVPSALLIRKEALLSLNMFDESLEVSSDFDLIRRLRKAHFKEANVDQLLLKKWYHGSNASQNKPVLRNEILGLLYRQIKGK